MKKLSFLIATLLVLATAAACSSPQAENAADNNTAAQGSSNGSDTEKTYYIGTRGTNLGYTYIDENDNLTGFDVEVIREIGNRIDGVNFEFKTMTLESCFVSLEAGQIDIISNQLVHNEERDAKYTFTQTPYSYTVQQIAVRGDEDTVSSLEDLQGKTICLVPTSESTAIVNAFNETAQTPIEIIFTDTGSAESLNLLATGRIDATIAHPIAVRNANIELGYDIKAVGERISRMPTYFILRQDDESRELAEKIDTALQSMIDDGTLLELSYQFLEDDYINE